VFLLGLALAGGGRIVMPGALGDPMVTLNIWTLVSKGAKVIAAGAATTTPQGFDHIIELAGKGEIRPVIDRELPLAQAPEAHRLIENRQVFGKIVLRVRRAKRTRRRARPAGRGSQALGVRFVASTWRTAAPTSDHLPREVFFFGLGLDWTSFPAAAARAFCFFVATSTPNLAGQGDQC
jgi:hypothetical protein